MSNKYDITLIGNAPVDSIVQVEEDVITHFGLTKGGWHGVSTGEISTEKMNELERSFKDIYLEAGGAAANTAWALGMLGTKTAFIGRVGQDNAGAHFYNDMKMAGINMPLPEDEARTMSIYSLVTPDGQRTFVSRGCPSPLKSVHVVEDYIFHSDWLLIEGYLLQDEAQLDAVDKAFKTIRKSEGKVILTLAATNVIENAFGRIADEIMAGVDLLVGNEDEISTLIVATDKFSHEYGELLAKKIHATPRLITHGADGATYIDTKQNRTFIACPPIVDPLDTTGAGDNFLAGFLEKYLTDPNDVEEAIYQGHRIAHHAIKQMGGRLENLNRELLFADAVA